MPPDRLTRRSYLAAVTATAALGAGCQAQTAEDPTTTVDGTTTAGRTTTAGGSTVRTETTSVGGTAGDAPTEALGETRTDATAANESDLGGASVYTGVYRDTIDSVVLVQTDFGSGSGWMYDQRHVVTNQHVVADAERVVVRFNRGEWREATVVGTDANSDLAALEVERVPDYARPLPLVADDPPIGARVVALGNPFGLDRSLSAGIVSGQDRSLPSPSGFSIPDTVQTDAAVNPGNSGGPLLALDGEVVGVISAGGGDNIAFAISAALVRRVVPVLIEEGAYEHSYMGVQLRDVGPAIAEANGLDAARGVIVTDTLPDGPSEGILQGSPRETTAFGRSVPVGGDVIVALDGQPVSTLSDLSTHLALETRPGDELAITVLRDGERETVTITLAARPDQ